MKLRQILENVIPRPSRAFSTTTTEMPLYDNMLKNPKYFREQKGIQWTLYKSLSPERYILRCMQARNISRETLYNNRDPDKIQEYADKMMNGEQFPLPVLDYSNGFGQEGLHRAFAAVKIGLAIMPYMVVSKV